MDRSPHDPPLCFPGKPRHRLSIRGESVTGKANVVAFASVQVLSFCAKVGPMEITLSRVAVIAIGEEAIEHAMKTAPDFDYDHVAVTDFREVLRTSEAVARGCGSEDGIECPLRQAGHDPQLRGSVARSLAFAWDDVSRQAIPKMPSRTPHIVRIAD